MAYRKRRRIPGRKSRKLFTRTARKVKKRNYSRPTARGGYRL